MHHALTHHCIYPHPQHTTHTIHSQHIYVLRYATSCKVEVDAFDWATQNQQEEDDMEVDEEGGRGGRGGGGHVTSILVTHTTCDKNVGVPV